MLGGTDMNTGLQEAVDLFAATDDGLPWNKIIILFSDGCYNIGDESGHQRGRQRGQRQHRRPHRGVPAQRRRRGDRRADAASHRRRDGRPSLPRDGRRFAESGV